MIESGEGEVRKEGFPEGGDAKATTFVPVQPLMATGVQVRKLTGYRGVQRPGRGQFTGN